MTDDKQNIILSETGKEAAAAKEDKLPTRKVYFTAKIPAIKLDDENTDTSSKQAKKAATPKKRKSKRPPAAKKAGQNVSPSKKGDDIPFIKKTGETPFIKKTEDTPAIKSTSETPPIKNAEDVSAAKKARATAAAKKAEETLSLKVSEIAAAVKKNEEKKSSDKKVTSKETLPVSKTLVDKLEKFSSIKFESVNATTPAELAELAELAETAEIKIGTTAEVEDLLKTEESSKNTEQIEQTPDESLASTEENLLKEQKDEKPSFGDTGKFLINKKTRPQEIPTNEKDSKISNKKDVAFLGGSLWQEKLKPITFILSIFLVFALLGGVFNFVFASKLAQSKFPPEITNMINTGGKGFTSVLEAPDGNILAVYKANNNAGYVVHSQSRGYNGMVPALVALNNDGVVLSVVFPKNNETYGLGKNIETSPSFKNQFTGADIAGIDSTKIDGIAGATLSSSAATLAVNIAIEYFANMMGLGIDFDLEESVLKELVPSAASFKKLDIKKSGIAAVYLANNGTIVIVGFAGGVHSKVYAAIALNTNDTIANIWLDTSGETEGYGADVQDEDAFKNSFIGEKSTSSVGVVDVIAQATHTRSAIVVAVDNALAALPQAREAANK